MVAPPEGGRRHHGRQDQHADVRAGWARRTTWSSARPGTRGASTARRAGSSGGASAAVAAGLAPDRRSGPTGAAPSASPRRSRGSSATSPPTAGSRRIRASAAWSLSHIGPMTRTVADAALAMQVCAGPDERDPYSLPASGVNYVRAIRGRHQGTPGRLRRGPGEPRRALDPEVRRATARAARAFRELGCRVETVAPALAVARASAGTRSSAAASARGSSRIGTVGPTSSPASWRIMEAPPLRTRRADTCRPGSSGWRGGSTRARSSSATISC